MKNNNKEKTVLITGAAGTIGFTLTETFLNLGHSVIMLDNNADKLIELSSKITGNIFPCICDLSNHEDIERAYLNAADAMGNIDILVNNAGILTNNKSQNTSVEEWKKVIDINLNAVFYLTKLVIPGMIKQKWGRIINTSSLAAKSGGITAGTAYSTSKGALMSLTFSLAAELAPYGITVNGIAPAYVKTPMVTEQLNERQRQELLKEIPVGRFCEPEEFAHVVTFLADELGGFITGEIIDQNGGLYFD